MAILGGDLARCRRECRRMEVSKPLVYQIDQKSPQRAPKEPPYILRETLVDTFHAPHACLKEPQASDALKSAISFRVSSINTQR